jgi:hypothetical protein
MTTGVRSGAGDADPLNIDAKLNGAFILLGLLYGEGDLARSIRYAMAAGQDSDCNPANVGSVLGAYYGARVLGEADTDWLSALDETRVFDTTEHTLDDLVRLNVELARRAVIMRGGRAEVGGAWHIPRDDDPPPVIAEQWPRVANEPPALGVDVSLDGSVVTITASATDDDGVAAYHCFFGDLTHAPGRIVEHRYRAPGRYEIIVFAADTTGNTSHRVVPVVVPASER